ncbi:hypothetical protein [Lysobacter fragariae]
MIELRNLLLDCRTALRKADRHFEISPLREQLDDMIIELGEAGVRQRIEAQRPENAEPPPVQRVAYAWQSVARELRHTHADLFRQLSERVLERLDIDALGDEDDEIQSLQDDLKQSQATLAKTTAELSALRTALANAVPLADTLGGSESELAQQRMQMLLQAVSSGGGLRKPAPAAAADGTPTRTTLQAVVAGQRALTNNEREWCIGEAMVLTGFQQTPVQLLAQGDVALAQLVLDGKPTA